MFLAIINDTYSEVKEDLATRESEFDLGLVLIKFLNFGILQRKNARFSKHLRIYNKTYILYIKS